MKRNEQVLGTFRVGLFYILLLIAWNESSQVDRNRIGKGFNFVSNDNEFVGFFFPSLSLFVSISIVLENNFLSCYFYFW